MHKLAIIGDRSSVLAFKALGMDVFSPEDEEDIRATVDSLARKDYGVIYITETLAVKVPETIERYKTRSLPAIILIPDSGGSLGLGQEEIQKNLEKAVGRDIF